MTFHPAKRARTLAERGLDFADAVEVFAGCTFSAEDDRRDYGEIRIVTTGFFEGRMVVIVWTQRGDDRHVINMSKANEREQEKYRERFG